MASRLVRLGGAALAVALSGPIAAQAAEYYVDCSRPGESGSGLDETQAWTSLDPANDRTFRPGDSILLRRGTRCYGMLRPRGSGIPGNPITLAAYGVGPRPVIDAGDLEAAIHLFNQSHWHVRSLETTGGNPFGILVSGDVQGVLEHFRIIDVDVHDVRGVADNKESGLIVVTPRSAETVFNDVIIDGATAHSTKQWAGILIGGDDFGGTPNSPRTTNAVIRNSVVHDVYGDGIILFQVNGGLIESSVVHDTGRIPDRTVGTPNGIWTWMCGDCTVQFNEGYRTSSPWRDGGVFDIDFGCSSNTVQYNYGHDAEGYCVAIFAADGWTTFDSVVRYNICADNGRHAWRAKQGDIYVFTWDGGLIDGLEIYNNTIYWNPDEDAHAINLAADFTGDRRRIFKNNIVYSTVPGLVRVSVDSRIDLDHNVYWYSGLLRPTWQLGSETLFDLAEWKQRGHDAASLYADPRLHDPSRREARLPQKAFSPRRDSPAIDAGATIDRPSRRDYIGNPVPAGRATDIGALEQHAERLRDRPAGPFHRDWR